MNVRIATSSIAFTLVVSALIVTASLRGETKETSREEICSTIAWPMIPANCLEGVTDRREVRMVGADVDAFDAETDAEEVEEHADMQARFATDFN